MTAQANADPAQQQPAAAAAPDELDRLLGGMEAEAGQVTGAGPAANDDELPTADVLKLVIGPGFALLAPNWNISPSEVEQLATVYGALVDKYFPGGVGKLGPEISAALITVAILAPRLGKPRKIEPGKPQASEAANDAGSD